MEKINSKSLFMVVNVDWFFLSHRLPIALYAKEQGWKVTIVTSDTGKREEIESYGLDFIDFPFERSSTNPITELKCLFKLSRIYTKFKPDVIHHVTLKTSLIGSCAAKLSGCKSVVNAISGFGYTFTDNRKGLLQLVVRQLIKICYKSRTFHFILQNPDDFQTVSKLSLVPEKNIHLIKGSGVDMKQFYYTPVDNLKRVQFLFLARILRDKGVIEFIEAAKTIKDRNEEQAEFLLVGDIDVNNPTSISQNKMNALVDGDYIKWIGFRKDVMPLIQESSVVVLPSYREGLPKSLIEACAIGRAIITTNVTGCKECVDNQVNGLLIPAKETKELALAYEYFINNRDKITEFGHNSRKKAEAEFAIENVIEKTINIYAQFTKKIK